ncbi:hypothetical protein MJ749_13235 [Paenibacillus polymyxa]|uniref:hypothetical protein n=1 Tax=Paenibacillus polymyxa TaxID=1406 RepID=UPI001C9DBFB9|nr:hypothetical protein [Paenibacillus polymyxa]MBY7736269.1 hypothetical protein [Paenibacillus polymyxa]UMR33663.1 hypothetical protein MJ749_13235 [Paenibacillus polymyxa]
MNSNQLAHELTILFLKNSLDLSGIKTPEEYVKVYQENFQKILNEIGEQEGFFFG